MAAPASFVGMRRDWQDFRDGLVRSGANRHSRGRAWRRNHGRLRWHHGSLPARPENSVLAAGRCGCSCWSICRAKPFSSSAPSVCSSRWDSRLARMLLGLLGAIPCHQSRASLVPAVSPSHPCRTIEISSGAEARDQVDLNRVPLLYPRPLD